MSPLPDKNPWNPTELLKEFQDYTVDFLDEYNLDQRVGIYSEIQAAVLGQRQDLPDPLEVALLSWGIFNDPEMNSSLLPFGWTEMVTLMDQKIRNNPQSPLRLSYQVLMGVAQSTVDPSKLGVVKDDAIVNAVIDAAAGSLVTRAIAPSLRILSTNIASRLAANESGRILRAARTAGKGLRGLGRAARKHPIITAGASIAIPGWLGVFSGEEGTTESQPVEDQVDPTLEPEPTGGTRTLVDVETGEVLQVPVGTPQPAGAIDFSGDLGDIQRQLGVSLTPQGVPSDINELFLGGLTINEEDFPFGVDPRGRAVTSGGPDKIPEYLDTSIPASQRGDLSFRRQYGQTIVPPGGQIWPAAFTEYQGNTLFQWSLAAASRAGVPPEIMYGMITMESGWDPMAISSDGQSIGLAQIHLPSNPTVTREAALNPVFAVEWLAESLSQSHNEFDSWEAAFVAKRNPEGARVLAESGVYMTAADKSFAQQIALAAEASGIGNIIWGSQGSLINAPVGGGGSGRAPFQAPDPATIREWLPSVYEEVFGRSKPTDEELEAGVEKVTALMRQAYNAQGSGQDIDAEARFVEELKGTGEAQFHGERQQVASVHDYMGDLVSILRGAP